MPSHWLVTGSLRHTFWWSPASCLRSFCWARLATSVETRYGVGQCNKAVRMLNYQCQTIPVVEYQFQSLGCVHWTLKWGWGGVHILLLCSLLYFNLTNNFKSKYEFSILQLMFLDHCRQHHGTQMFHLLWVDVWMYLEYSSPNMNFPEKQGMLTPSKC